jgi:hypothetical protein
MMLVMLTMPFYVHAKPSVLEKKMTKTWYDCSPCERMTIRRYAKLAEHALRDFSQAPNVDLFWRARLLSGLRYVNTLEAVRRTEPLSVATEQVVEGGVALGNGTQMQLHGRIDRVETREGGITIIDHKTGTAPSEKEILEGRALQLLAYRMILSAPLSAQTNLSRNSPSPEKREERFSTSPSGEVILVEAIEYWALPKLGAEGAVTHVAAGTPAIAEIEKKLRAALTHMLDEKTPFLAQPVRSSADERFGNDYAGISRYDEWAG